MAVLQRKPGQVTGPSGQGFFQRQGARAGAFMGRAANMLNPYKRKEEKEQRSQVLVPPETGVGEGHANLNEQRRIQDQLDLEYEEEQKRKFGGAGEGGANLNEQQRIQEQFDREYEEEQRRKFGGDVTPGPDEDNWYEMEAIDKGLLPEQNFSPDWMHPSRRMQR